MKYLKHIITFYFILFIFNNSATEFDCASRSPEMSGFHNMVLFGHPDDLLYAYHLPLFSGEINGQHGHVLMHIYQGIWNVQFDKETATSYEKVFYNKWLPENPYPFFSLGPRGKSFKVPEMICQKNFETKVAVTYGHIENNPSFPSPKPLMRTLSTMKTLSSPVFAQRFKGDSKNELTYILFGTDKQKYLAHFLTDDENSFDQILAVSIKDKIKKTITHKATFVTFDTKHNPNLVKVANGSLGKNNSLALPTKKLGEKLNGKIDNQSFEIKVEGLIYYNDNRDLKINK